MVFKYVQFARNERNITTGASQQVVPLSFVSDDDCTIVGVNVEIAFSIEAPTDVGTSNVAGYARLVVVRSNEAIPLIQPSGAWDTTSASVANTLLDADSGDTWAIAPFAFGAGASLSAAAATSQVNIRLAPATKRRLRRGDQLQVEINYSNGANQNTAHQEVVTGTLFVQG